MEPGDTMAEVEPPAVGESYRIVKELGSGAAGEVWLVENVRVRRLEALKILKPVDKEHARLIAQGRFKREIRAAQLLSHPNVVATFDGGQLADGRMFLTMEYVEGASLHAMLRERGPFPIALVLGIMAEIAEAIDHAHLAGVVHRDLKPQNVLLADRPDGKIVRVLDFGMAKILHGDQDSLVLSADGAIFGTPIYMSPEQCKGMPPDPRSDLYALGCVGFELLVGEPPFRGPLAKLFTLHVTQEPRAPSTVDPKAGIAAELDAVILRCLEKDPAARFQTGADLSAAIRAIPGYRPLRVPSLGVVMPHSVSFDLKQLVRVCLNDPDLKKDVEDALAEGALPVRTPIANVADGNTAFQAMLETNRDKSPGQSGFLERDNLGWLSARLAEIIKTDHEASTISAEQMAEKLGVTVDQLKKRD